MIHVRIKWVNIRPGRWGIHLAEVMVVFQKIGWPVLSEMYVAEQSSMKILSIFFSISVPDSCHNSCCCCSVAQFCPAVCDPMNCSTQLPCPSLSPRVCSNSCPLSQWCYLTIYLCSLLLLPSFFPASGSFPVSWLFPSGDPSIEASVSVLPMNIQGWFPIGLTGLISLQSKGLSRVFSSTTGQKHQFFGAQPYGPALTSVHEYWKNHSYDYMDICWQNDVSAFQYAI